MNTRAIWGYTLAILTVFGEFLIGRAENGMFCVFICNHA